jgi:hypothetical protein
VPEVSPDDPTVRQLAYSTALAHRTLDKAVLLKALLQLPRLATHFGTVTSRQASDEIERLVDLLPPIEEWTVRTPYTIKSLRFQVIPDAIAEDICRRFHYLGSPRWDVRSYGLVGLEDEVVAIGMTTICDVDHLGRLSERAFGDPSPRVLARVFAFEGAPRNVLTRMFRFIGRAEIEFGSRTLVTYVNPNLGFTGVSYRAGNWSSIGTEGPTVYRYLDGTYITDRELARQLGNVPATEPVLRDVFGDRYSRSRMSLRPLLVFGRNLAHDRASGVDGFGANASARPELATKPPGKRSV